MLRLPEKAKKKRDYQKRKGVHWLITVYSTMFAQHLRHSASRIHCAGVNQCSVFRHFETMEEFNNKVVFWPRAYNAEAVLQIDMLLGIIAGFDICQKLLIFLTFSLVYKTIRQSQWAGKGPGRWGRPVGKVDVFHYIMFSESNVLK